MFSREGEDAARVLRGFYRWGAAPRGDGFVSLPLAVLRRRVDKLEVQNFCRRRPLSFSLARGGGAAASTASSVGSYSSYAIDAPLK